MTFLKLLVEPTSEALVPLVTSSSADFQDWKRAMWLFLHLGEFSDSSLGPLSSSGKQQGGGETFIFPFSSPVQSSGLSVACHSLSRAPSIDFSTPLLSPSHHSLSRLGPWETDIGRVSICFLHLWHVLRSLISFALSAASESCDTPPLNAAAHPSSPPQPAAAFKARRLAFKGENTPGVFLRLDKVAEDK